MCKSAEGVHNMSFSVQNDVTVSNNQMSFRAKKIPKKAKIFNAYPPETDSGMKNIYEELIGELKSLQKPIQDTKQLEHERTQALRAQALAKLDTKTLTTSNSLLDVPTDKAHFITKDLDTDVAANMERRFKEQLLREQEFRFDAAKDIEGYR